jgi:hypothetical protein
MKCKLLHDTPAAPTIPPNKTILPAGTVIDHPDAWLLVQMGAAEAVDRECELKADRTPEQLKQAQYEHLRTRRGISPEDYAAYDAGEIVGYNADGSAKPGPSFVDEDEEEPNIILPDNYEEYEDDDE